MTYSFFVPIKNFVRGISQFNADLKRVINRLKLNILQLNVSKSKVILIFVNEHILFLGNDSIPFYII